MDDGAGAGHTRDHGAHAAGTQQTRTAITNGGGSTILQNDTRGGTETIPMMAREDTVTGILTVDAMARGREITTVDAIETLRETTTFGKMGRIPETTTVDAIGSPREITTVDARGIRLETTAVDAVMRNTPGDTTRAPDETLIVAAAPRRHQDVVMGAALPLSERSGRIAHAIARGGVIDATMADPPEAPERQTRRMLKQSGRASWHLCSLPPPSWTSIDKSASPRWRSESVRHAKLTTRAARGVAIERLLIVCTSRRVPSTWETGWGEGGKDIRGTTTEHIPGTYIIRFRKHRDRKSVV